MRISCASLAEIIAFCDIASGKVGSTGAKRARTAIVVVGQHTDGWALALDAIAGQWPTTEITEKIFATQDKWHCRRFGIESSAQQSLYVDTVINEAATRRQRICIVPVPQPTTMTKEFRITASIQKWLNNGMLYIAPVLVELMKELKEYPRGQTCDIVDALASALNMLRDPFTTKRRVEYAGDHSLDSNTGLRYAGSREID